MAQNELLLFFEAKIYNILNSHRAITTEPIPLPFELNLNWIMAVSMSQSEAFYLFPVVHTVGFKLGHFRLF